MRIAVIGGSGLIGSHIAAEFHSQGHDVLIIARAPHAASLPGGLDLLARDYAAGEITARDLEGTDAVVLAAGNDLRHRPAGVDDARFWNDTQIEGVPRLVATARRAGVSRVVQVGSFYHQVRPELVAGDPYVRARALADERARALSAVDFAVMTVNPPVVVGWAPRGLEPRYRRLAEWALGRGPVAPRSAPEGGTNYITAPSLAQAVAGAVEQGESGRAYLVGGENLTYAAFAGLFLRAAGEPADLTPALDPHPLWTDLGTLRPPGYEMFFEPDPAETALLGYTPADVEREVAAIVERVAAEA